MAISETMHLYVVTNYNLLTSCTDLSPIIIIIFIFHAICQPTRPTQPFIPSGSIYE